MSAIGIPRHVGTIDPRNVEHILKSRIYIYQLYIKKKPPYLSYCLIRQL